MTAVSVYTWDARAIRFGASTPRQLPWLSVKHRHAPSAGLTDLAEVRNNLLASRLAGEPFVQLVRVGWRRMDQHL